MQLYYQDFLLNFVILLLRGLGDIAISMKSIRPSIHLSVHKFIIVHPITPNYPLSYFQETVRL